MRTNEFEWAQDMYRTDTIASTEKVEGERIYTLLLADFFRLPEINYSEVLVADSHIRALLN